MVLKRPTKAGRRFFKADELKPDSEATIVAPPYYEQVSLEDGTSEERFRVPIRYRGEEGLWTPGDTAANLLIDELGDDETKWPEGTVRFCILEVQTKTGTRYAKGAHAVQGRLAASLGGGTTTPPPPSQS
jgi:hypothetical protein